MKSLNEIAEGLAPGESFRSSCPFCKAEHERSFAVYRLESGECYYKCHRASCGIAGTISSETGTVTNTPTKQKRMSSDNSFHGDYISREDFLFTYDTYLREHERYAIDRDSGIRFTRSAHFRGHERYDIGAAILLPLKDSWGIEWGMEARIINRDPVKVVRYDAASAGIKRALHFTNSFGWASTPFRRTPILVEDWFSAEYLCAIGYQAIALLGTNLTKLGVKELLNVDKRHCTLWLDSGATASANKIVEKWDGILSFRVINVPEGTLDPKLLTAKDIKNILGDVPKPSERV